MYKIVRLLQEPSPEVITGRHRCGDAVFPGGLVLPRGAAFEAAVVKCENLWTKVISRQLGGGFAGIFDRLPEDTPGCEIEPTTRMNLATDIGDVDLMLFKMSRQRMLSLTLRHDLFSVRFKFRANYTGVRTGRMPEQRVYYWGWNIA